MDEKIYIKETRDGMKATFRKKTFFLKYPEKIWKSYPKDIRAVLTDNLAFLLTMNLPLVARIDKLHYNTAMPGFQPFFQSVALRSAPSAIEDYPLPTYEAIKRMMNIHYDFGSHDVRLPDYHEKLLEKAVVAFSTGKDSLLTMAVADELGLDPVGVYVNDTVSPIENRLKRMFMQRFSKENKIPIFEIINQFEQLNDYETWQMPENSLGYSHMVTGFCLVVLPVCHAERAKYILVGNQQNMNFPYINKDGFNTFPSYDQMRTWTLHQSTLARLMTANQAVVSSLIEPLTNLAETKVLFDRYPDFAKYQVSCDMSENWPDKESRWCYNCNKCARLFVFMKANNVDVKAVNFKKDFFDRQCMKYYVLFGGAKTDEYERSSDARDEQLLSFYLASKHGARGWLIDEFKRRFHKEAKQREDELIKRFMKPHEPLTIPEKLRKRVMAIYHEELKDF